MLSKLRLTSSDQFTQFGILLFSVDGWRQTDYTFPRRWSVSRSGNR
ncbi:MULTISPECIES: hypothetical protein [Shouchella]|nr:MULTISPECIES: hypothetical protein [Shouchella]MBX0320360.1 hypothetical protein [Shouchella clausii]MDO7282659.1 hypothetical protein [Shouchella clausii]MDO7302756.1 hypothetical protein [Shouchella clausii]